MSLNSSSSGGNSSGGFSISNLYICKTFDFYGKGGIYKDIYNLVESRDFDANIYTYCIEIIKNHLVSLPSEQSGGRKKKRTLCFRKKTLHRR